MLMFAAFSLFFLCATAASPALRVNGQFAIADPAFISVIGNATSGDQSIVVTSFSGSPFTKGSVWSAPYDKNVSNIQPVKQFGGLEWPNNITPLPKGGYIFGDGFLVPGKDNGNMYLVDSAQQLHALTSGEKGFFYHKGYLFDVDGDGHEDVITAKAHKPLLGSGEGELVWLRNPGSPASYPWKETKLADGPDIDIFVHPVNSTTAYIFAAEFFGKKLSMFVLQNGGIVASRVLDDSIGEVYCVRAGSITGSGDLELVVSNYHYSQAGSVFLYQGPPTFSKRSTIASGFKNKQFAPGSGAPGWLYPHYPTAHSSGPMSIFVCGDGAETLTLLTPNSTNTWQISFQKDYESTVGAMALGDWNKDGYTDAFVTDYNNGLVHAFTYAS